MGIWAISMSWLLYIVVFHFPSRKVAAHCPSFLRALLTGWPAPQSNSAWSSWLCWFDVFSLPGMVTFSTVVFEGWELELKGVDLYWRPHAAWPCPELNNSRGTSEGVCNASALCVPVAGQGELYAMHCVSVNPWKTRGFSKVYNLVEDLVRKVLG